LIKLLINPSSIKKDIFIVLPVIAMLVLAVPTGKVKAWHNNDHVKMVDQAVVILKNDFKEPNSQSADLQKYLTDYLPDIKKGASDADIFSTTISNKVFNFNFLGKAYEIYTPTAEHYYDVRTGRGALGYFRSARQKADEYYATAKQKFIDEKYNESFVFLGMAIHMAQDVSFPQHPQIGLGATMNWDGFANHASANFIQYSVTAGGIYTEPNIGQMVYDNAVLGASYFKYVDGFNRFLSWFNLPTDDDYFKAATATMARAEQTTAGIVAMFLQEVLLQP